MAKPGPKPKPTSMKVLQGKFPGGETSKVAVEDVGSPPSYFNSEAKKVWEYFRVQLMRYRIISKLDLVALENLCLATVFRRQAARKLFRGRITRADPKQGGRQAKNPAWQIYRDAQAAERQWAEQLGLTPAARERLKIEPPQPVDELEDLLSETLEKSAPLKKTPAKKTAAKKTATKKKSGAG